MPGTRLDLIECNDDALWEHLLTRSAQATVFSTTGFLRSLGRRFRRYLIGSPAKPVALCCAVEDDSGEQLLAVDYTPYQGILFLTDSALLPRQRIVDELRIMEFAVTTLTERYRTIAMPLSWRVDDIRPFLWHHYHEPQQGQFKVTPRYTAVLDLAHAQETEFVAQSRACRRQELRKGAAYVVREERDVGLFMQLYEMTFARQDIVLPESALALVRRIAEAALAQGFGRLSSCVTDDGVAAMTLFLFDWQRAYYLFGANRPDLRNSGAATRLMFENIGYAKQRGLAELDFVGVNSPKRGDFKLSFNPQLKLYFDLRYERPTRPAQQLADGSAAGARAETG